MIDSRHSQAIRLKYYEGKSQLEIAEIMGIGAATISDWIGEKDSKLPSRNCRRLSSKFQKTGKIQTNEQFFQTRLYTHR